MRAQEAMHLAASDGQERTRRQESRGAQGPSLSSKGLPAHQLPEQ